MKYAEIELGKILLIVEVPRLEDYEFFNKDSKYLRVGKEEKKLNISTLAKIGFLSKGDEFPAFNLFIKALRSKGYYWGDNGFGGEPKYITGHGNPKVLEMIAKSLHNTWKEAQARTFNPELTYIFAVEPTAMNF